MRFSTLHCLLCAVILLAGCASHSTTKVSDSNPTNLVQNKTLTLQPLAKQLTDSKNVVGEDSLTAFKKCMPTDRAQILVQVWERAFPKITNNISTKLADRDGGNYLYDVQQLTNNLLKAAIACPNLIVIDQISEMLLAAFKPALFTKIGSYKTWTDKKQQEYPALYIGQFLHLVSETIHAIVRIPSSARTTNMQKLLGKSSIVLLDHYYRWAFVDPFMQVRSKKGGKQTHFEAVKEFLLGTKNPKGRNDRPAHYYSMRDRDMWIVSGLVEVLAAIAKEPQSFPADVVAHAGKFEDYLNIALQVIEARTIETALKDFAGKPTFGFVFEPGIWDKHDPFEYSAYSGPSYPTKKDRGVVSSVAMDTSHARRYVHVYDTLYKKSSYY